MWSASKTVTVVNLIAAGILWLLGFLTFIFNVCGLWGAWHIVGFGFLFYIPVPVFSHIVALADAFLSSEKDNGEMTNKYKIINSVSLAVSAFIAVFTLTVSSTWFW